MMRGSVTICFRNQACILKLACTLRGCCSSADSVNVNLTIFNDRSPIRPSSVCQHFRRDVGESLVAHGISDTVLPE